MSAVATPPRPKVSEAKIKDRLRRSKSPRTASQLGVTPARLRSIEGVVQVGTTETGKRGRPAALFTLQED